MKKPAWCLNGRIDYLMAPERAYKEFEAIFTKPMPWSLPLEL